MKIDILLKALCSTALIWVMILAIMFISGAGIIGITIGAVTLIMVYNLAYLIIGLVVLALFCGFCFHVNCTYRGMLK